jgi:hypothetical protein
MIYVRLGTKQADICEVYEWQEILSDRSTAVLCVGIREEESSNWAGVERE